MNNVPGFILGFCVLYYIGVIGLYYLFKEFEK